tara:strand:+ start:1653 stop:1841 length:189 start_codon:yes stop_codon:yes gene_type:complete
LSSSEHFVEQLLLGVMTVMSLMKETCTTIKAVLGRLFKTLSRERKDLLENLGDVNDYLHRRY